MVEMQEKGASALTSMTIARLDLQHGLGVIGNTVPNAKRPQHAGRGQGQRIGPPVKPCCVAGGAGERVNNGHAQARCRQRQGQRRAIQPAAHDQDIGVMCHDAVIAWRAALSMRQKAKFPVFIVASRA